MEQLNRIQLRGRIGNVRVNPVGDKSVCHFSVATNILYRNQEGTAVEEATWHNCTLWSNKKYKDFDFLAVGRGVEVVGRIKNAKYTGTDGVERYSSDIVVSDATILPEDEPLKAESAI